MLNQKADLMRYEIVLRHGGIYLDADMECLGSLNSILSGDPSLIVCSECSNDQICSNGFFAADAGHTSLKLAVGSLETAVLGKHAPQIETGPLFWRGCIYKSDPNTKARTMSNFQSSHTQLTRWTCRCCPR